MQHQEFAEGLHLSLPWLIFSLSLSKIFLTVNAILFLHKEKLRECGLRRCQGEGHCTLGPLELASLSILFPSSVLLPAVFPWTWENKAPIAHPLNSWPLHLGWLCDEGPSGLKHIRVYYKMLSIVSHPIYVSTVLHKKDESKFSSIFNFTFSNCSQSHPDFDRDAIFMLYIFLSFLKTVGGDNLQSSPQPFLPWWCCLCLLLFSS